MHLKRSVQKCWFFYHSECSRDLVLLALGLGVVKVRALGGVAALLQPHLLPALLLVLGVHRVLAAVEALYMGVIGVTRRVSDHDASFYTMKNGWGWVTGQAGTAEEDKTM